MASKKVVIIGGVAGGATAAARLRRLDEQAHIILIERGEDISFANCGLPYYIGGIIQERGKLLVTTPPAMTARYGLDIRTRTEARRIDPQKKEVELYDFRQKTSYVETYDALILSPGASPIRPPIPGISDPRIFTLRNLPDADAIKQYLDERRPKHAVIVGGGYIGLEMAESLHHAGVKVTICEKLAQVMMPLDFEMAALAHQHIQTRNVELYLHDGVQRFDAASEHLRVYLESGKVLTTDMAIFSIGVRPEVELARAAGLKLGESGGIWVDEYLRASDPNIYAVGDAIETTHFVTQEKFLARLAGPANKQGRIAANNICGHAETYGGSLATGIARVFGLTVASAGANERMLRNANILYKTALIHAEHHAGYYPGAEQMSVKLLFSPVNGKLLGAQVIGMEGVDKRIDVLATAMMMGATAADVERLELAYAPPYGSAKDPVNLAGFVAHNILKGETTPIYWHELADAAASPEIFLLDVRAARECALGMIPGAKNIPLDELRERLRELPKDKRIIIYCQIGVRGYVAERILRQRGFRACNLIGGYKTYRIATGKQRNDDGSRE